MTQTIWTPPVREHLETFAGLTSYSPTTVRQTKGRNITIMAHAGAGKTTLAATAIKSRFGWPMQFVDIEGGSHVLDENEGIDIVKVKNTADWKRYYAELKRNFNNKEKFPYLTVCIDNLTELSNIRIAEEKPKYNDPRQAYGVVTDEIMEITRFLRDMSNTTMINVIVNVWIEHEKDEGEGVTLTRVQFNPAIQKAYPGVVDMIGNLTLENDPPKYTRKLSFIPIRSDAKLRRAKTDTNAQRIPIELWNPDLGAILDTLIGGDEFDTARYTKPTRIAPKSEEEK
jgi:phage nucleotide-binding protein